MQKLHFTIEINAPKGKVWNIMLADSTYREWTKAFHEGSYYKGDWSEGSKMLFLGPDEAGKKDGGMVSRIKTNRKYEFISIEHLGMVIDGVEDTTSEEIKKWAPSFENYTFTEKNGNTELVVDIDVYDEYKEIFEDMWLKALLKLKEIVEQSVV